MVDWGQAFENINYVAVLVAALAPLLVGFIWYSDSVFLKPWAKETGLSKKEIESKEGMEVIFTSMIVLNLIASFILGLLMYGTEGVIDGLVFGSVVGLAFGAGQLGTHYLFARKTLKLFAIDAGSTILTLATMGLVHGLIN